MLFSNKIKKLHKNLLKRGEDYDSVFSSLISLGFKLDSRYSFNDENEVTHVKEILLNTENGIIISLYSIRNKENSFLPMQINVSFQYNDCKGGKVCSLIGVPNKEFIMRIKNEILGGTNPQWTNVEEFDLLDIYDDVFFSKNCNNYTELNYLLSKNELYNDIFSNDSYNLLLGRVQKFERSFNRGLNVRTCLYVANSDKIRNIIGASNLYIHRTKSLLLYRYLCKMMNFSKEKYETSVYNNLENDNIDNEHINNK